MEEPNKKLQEPDTQPKIETPENTSENPDELTLDQIMTPSQLQYDLMKQAALAEVGTLKSNYAAALRNCIMSRCDMARITINNVLTQHLDLDKILMPQRSSKAQEEEEEEDDDVEDEEEERGGGGGGEGERGDERDEEEEEDDEAEEEDEDDQIVRNKKKGIIIDDTSMKTKGKVPMVDDTSEKSKKSKGKAPMVDDTSKKSKGKASIILSDHRADKVLEKKPIKLGFKSGAIANVGYWYKMLSESTGGKASKGNPLGSPGLVETTLHAEEASEVPGLVEVGGSVKTGLGWNRTIMESPEEIDVDDSETSEIEDNSLKVENEENLMSRKRKWDLRWENEEDMLLCMRTNRWLQMEAICALYRQESIAREEATSKLIESDYQKVTRLVEFLTDGNEHGSRVRTPEELEEIYPGSIALSSWLVTTYARELYHIYSNELDLYFFLSVNEV